MAPLTLLLQEEPLCSPMIGMMHQIPKTEVDYLLEHIQSQLQMEIIVLLPHQSP